MLFERLKKVREENNKKQREVAENLEVSLGTYAMNEAGLDTITLNNLIKFCDLFNVSIDYIFDINEKNEKKSYDSIKGYDKKILKERLKNLEKKTNLPKNK